MSESIFEPAAKDRYVPTEAALGPWSKDALHGGPPTMLMAREIERVPAEAEMLVTRLTVELLRPVGRAVTEARTRMVRPGLKVQLVEASLWQGEREVARATALRIRRAELPVPERDDPPPFGPADATGDWKGPYGPGPAYHLTGVEIRTPPDARDGQAPDRAWVRLRLPLIAGEEPSPLVRVCAAADFPNGISYLVDPQEVLYINPDLTVYVHRPPRGEWVMVDARTWLQPHGAGVADGALYDEHGRIGRSVQALLLEQRGDARRRVP
jgi:hypothetical protein